MGALGAVQLLQSSAVVRRQEHAIDRKRAFYLAEAGLTEAFTGLTVGRTGNVGSEAEPAVFGKGLFWVEATELDDERVQLDATGMAGSGRVALSLVAERGSAAVATLGIFSDQPLLVSPGVYVDGYDSSDPDSPALNGEEAPAEPLEGPEGEAQAAEAGETILADLGSNQGIEVVGTEENLTILYGNVHPGPGSHAITRGNVLVLGESQPSVTTQPLPPVALPVVTSAPAISHESPLPLVVPPGSFGMDTLHVASGAEVLVEGPATLVVASLVVQPQGTLRLDTENGPITLYVTEQLVLPPGSQVATSGQAPEDVVVQVAGATENPVVLASEPAFHGMVYAPEAEVRALGSFELFGSLVAHDLRFQAGARLHFDRHLGELAAEGALPSLLSWRILELGNEQAGGGVGDPFRLLGLDRSTLPAPAQAHADQQLDLTYKDGGGVTRTYSGLESGFDWSQATEVLSLVRDGESVLGTKQATAPDRTRVMSDAELVTLVNALDLPPKQLARALIDNSPLSASVLLALTTRVPALPQAVLDAVVAAQ